MINLQELQGNWDEIKGKLRHRWGQLTNDDLQSFDGNIDRLMGLIQRKTGEGREAVERFLNDVTEDGPTAVNQAAEAMRDYAHQASDRIQEGAQQAADAVRQGYEDAQDMVRSRPSEAAAICFGAGVLTGLVVAFLIHRK